MQSSSLEFLTSLIAAPSPSGYEHPVETQEAVAANKARKTAGHDARSKTKPGDKLDRVPARA